MRVVIPEILDSLDPGDPAAKRSRRDLRRLDGLLGCSRWVLRAARTCPESRRVEIAELGAGEGALCRRLFQAFPESRITGYDLAPAPDGLPCGIRWCAGDFLELDLVGAGGLSVGSLILHHFSATRLRQAGSLLRECRAVVFCEPFRSRLFLRLSRLLFPFVGPVTRHDMAVSIRAGFRRGELADGLRLDPAEWAFREQVSPAGILRFCAWRTS